MIAAVGLAISSVIRPASNPPLFLFAVSVQYPAMDSSDIPNHCGHGLRSERFVTPPRQISNGVAICPPLPRRTRVYRNRILVRPFAPIDFDGALLEAPSVQLTESDRMERVSELLFSSQRLTPSANSSFTRVGIAPPVSESFDEKKLCDSISEFQVVSSDSARAAVYEEPSGLLEEPSTLLDDRYSDVNGVEK